MSTLHLPRKKGQTHLQRAFQVFQRMHPQPIGARTLAALMSIEVSVAYNYIKRLKAAKCIEERGGSGKIPAYGIKDGAERPADDSRGGARRRTVCTGGAFEIAPAPLFAASGSGGGE